MLRIKYLICVMLCALVNVGCQSQPVAQVCEPLAIPAPPAWMMQPHEPNLTQRLLNELSESPQTVTRD